VAISPGLATSGRKLPVRVVMPEVDPKVASLCKSCRTLLLEVFPSRWGGPLQALKATLSSKMPIFLMKIYPSYGIIMANNSTPEQCRNTTAHFHLGVHKGEKNRGGQCLSLSVTDMSPSPLIHIS
jgi:hypothetical protein